LKTLAAVTKKHCLMSCVYETVKGEPGNSYQFLAREIICIPEWYRHVSKYFAVSVF
jgi:hypothetical protein